MSTIDEDRIWQVRAFVYEHFASTTRPPTIDETAEHYGLSVKQAATIYGELHRRHALFLEPNTTSIRMANPFSAVPTTFRVRARGKDYWANCAWDALGIPAALAADATIEAMDAQSQQSITLRVRNGQLVSHGEKIHLLLPFRRWYDDLAFT
jgi:hypothetical protein